MYILYTANVPIRRFGFSMNGLECFWTSTEPHIKMCEIMPIPDTEAKFCEVLHSKGIEDWTENVPANYD